jgi:hypothetical protein
MLGEAEVLAKIVGEGRQGRKPEMWFDILNIHVTI